MKKLIFAALFVAVAAAAQPAPSPRICHASQLPTCAGGPEPGRLVYVDDGASASDCSVGGGSSGHLCSQNADRTFSALGGGGGGGADGLGGSGNKGPFTVTGPDAATMNANSIGSAQVTDRTLTAADTTRTTFSFGNLGAAPTINWANGETQIATIDQASATFAPFTGGVSGGNYTLILTQDSSPGTLTWPASVRWPAGMGPLVNMDPNSVTLVHCFYDGTNYNCIGGAAGTEFTQGTADPTTGNPACGTGDVRSNTTTGALFWCSDGPTDTWSMIGEYTADPTGSVATMKAHALDIDDAPGFADAAGADPNPPPWSRASSWYSLISHNPDTYSIESNFNIAAWNYAGSGSVNPFLPQWSLVMEPAFGAGMRSGKEQQEIYVQWKVQQYRVVLASGGSGAIVLGTNLTFSGGEVCRPIGTDADLSNGAAIPMVCSNAAGTARDAPDPGDVITACTGPASPAACSSLPAGTVSGTPFDQAIAIRPMFVECLPEYPGCGVKLERGITAAGVKMYWMLASPGDGTLNLGSGGGGDQNISQVLIPSSPTASLGSGATPIVVQKSGGVGVDNDAGPQGGLFIYGDEDFSWQILGAVSTPCFTYPDLGTNDIGQRVRLNFWEDRTVVAIGCQNLDADQTNQATISLTKRGAGQIGSNLTCDPMASDMTFQEVTGDSDAVLTSGKAVDFSVVGTAPTVQTDDYLICLSVKYGPK